MIMNNRPVVLMFLLGIAHLWLACGRSSDLPETHSTSHEDSDVSNKEVIDRDQVVVPPQEYYDALLLREMRLADDPQASSSPILYVNFKGGQLERGYNADQSFLLCRQQVVLPAASYSPAEQDDIVQRVQKFFVDAGVNLLVTRFKPQASRFTTIYVTAGSMSSLGCRESQGTLGIAPLDHRNVNPDDIGFVFTKYVDDLQVTAETIAHEAGHTFGLEHIREKNGLMYYANNSKITGFIRGTISPGKVQDAPALLQEYVGRGPVKPEPTHDDDPTNPTSQEEPTQNQPAELPENPSNSSPQIPNQPTLPGWQPIAGFGNILKDLLGGQFPGAGQLPGLDLSNILGSIAQLLPIGQGQIPGLPIYLPGTQPGQGGLGFDLTAITQLIGNFSNLSDIFSAIGIVGQIPNQTPSAGQLPQIPGTNIPQLTNLTGLLSGLASPQSGGLGTLLGQLGGVQDLTFFNQGLENIFQMFSPQNGANLAPTAGSLIPVSHGLPDLAQIFGLNNIHDSSQLIDVFKGHSRWIHQTYTGPERHALLSAVKLAVLQQYKNMNSH